MSNNINPIQVMKTVPNSLDFIDEAKYVVLQGFQDNTWQRIVSTSFSNTQASFTAPPPSPTTAIWRKVYLYQPVTVTFNFDEAPLGQAVLQSQYDAFRAFPLASIIQTLTISYGGLDNSINLSDVTHILTRYNNDFYSQSLEFSTEPVTQDVSQSYAELANSNMNPLNSIVDSSIGSYRLGRGAFPYDTIVNPLGAGPGVPVQASIQANLVESLMLSPQYFGHLEPDSFLGLQTYNVNVTYRGDLSRLWSHDPSSPSVLGSINVVLGQPRLDINYSTPPAMLSIPKVLNYPYYPVMPYNTDGSPLNPVAPGASTSITTNTIQLNSIPKRIYIAVKRTRASESFSTTDTFFRITNLSINWNNRAGILSSASPEALYHISHKNGLNYPWALWRGNMRFMSGSTLDTISGIGSVIALDFGVDIPLHSDEAPGLRGTYMLQITANITNDHPSDAIVPSIYVVTVEEGIFTINRDSLSVSSHVGVITPQDILDSAMMPVGIRYDWARNQLYGGGFWGDVGKFLKKAGHSTLRFIEQNKDVILPLLMKAVSAVAAGEDPYRASGLYDANMMLGHTGKGLLTNGGATKVGGKKKRRKRRTMKGGKEMGMADIDERFEELEY